MTFPFLMGSLPVTVPLSCPDITGALILVGIGSFVAAVLLILGLMALFRR